MYYVAQSFAYSFARDAVFLPLECSHKFCFGIPEKSGLGLNLMASANDALQ